MPVDMARKVFLTRDESIMTHHYDTSVNYQRVKLSKRQVLECSKLTVARQRFQKMTQTSYRGNSILSTTGKTTAGLKGCTKSTGRK